MLLPYVKGEVEVVVASEFFLVSYSWGESSRTPSQKSSLRDLQEWSERYISKACPSGEVFMPGKK